MEMRQGLASHLPGKIEYECIEPTLVLPSSNAYIPASMGLKAPRDISSASGFMT